MGLEEDAEKLQKYNEWVKYARKTQNHFCKIFGNRQYDLTHIKNLHDKIGLVIFGYPKEMKYNEEEEKLIDQMKNKIISQSRFSGPSVKLAFVYLVIRLKSSDDYGIEVLFRVGLPGNKDVFIDLSLRVYTSWEDFLKTNKLPKCYMCSPNNGRYTRDNNGTVQLTFAESHACDIVSSLLQWTDVSSAVAGGLGLGITAVSLITPIGFPIVVGAYTASALSGGYDVFRNVAKLKDMYDHDKSIGLDNSEARKAWFATVSSTLGAVAVGSSAAVKTAQKLGKISEGSTELIKIFRILNLTSCCLSGVSALNGIISIVLKCLNGNLEKTDVFNFVLSCLFFFNAVVSMEMASRMISQISQNTINMNGGTTGMVTSVNPVLVVDSVSQNYNILLSLFIGLPACYFVYINSHLIECAILKIGKDTVAVWNHKIDLDEYATNVSEHLQKLFHKSYRNTVETTLNFVAKCRLSFKEESGQITPRPLNIESFHKMSIVVRSTAKNCSYSQNEGQIKKKENEIIRLFNDFNSEKPAEDVAECCFKLNFLCENLSNKFFSLKEEYENDLDIAKMKRDFNQKTFDQKYVNFSKEHVNDHFFGKCLKYLRKEFKKMYQKYQQVYGKEFLENLKQDYDCLLFQHCETGSIFPFCFPVGMANDVYFSCATEFAKVKIDYSNSKLIIMGHLVELRPLPGFNGPQVLFYTANHEDDTNYESGIGVIIKKGTEIKVHNSATSDNNCVTVAKNYSYDLFILIMAFFLFLYNWFVSRY